MKIAEKHNRLSLLIVLVLALSSLSLYALRVGPTRDPTTIEVLRNPERHEGKRLEMRGKLIDSRLEENTIYLTLEKYDETFDVYYEFGPDETFDDFEPGDIVRILGVTRLTTEGYVEAEIFYHRTLARDRALSIFSIIGFLLVLLFIIKDREVLKEMIFDG